MSSGFAKMRSFSHFFDIIHAISVEGSVVDTAVQRPRPAESVNSNVITCKLAESLRLHGPDRKPMELRRLRYSTVALPPGNIMKGSQAYTTAAKHDI